MKYIFIVTLFFLTASPVFAARSVEGTVPDLPPLQPAPENVFPNISNNIEYRGAPEELNTEEGNTDGSVNKDQESLGTQGSKKNNRWFLWLVNEEGSGGFVKNIAFFFFVIVVLGAGVYYFKRGK